MQFSVMQFSSDRCNKCSSVMQKTNLCEKSVWPGCWKEEVEMIEHLLSGLSLISVVEQ